MYNSNAPRRKLLHDHTWQINQVPFNVPVILPATKKELKQCIFEVTDKNGDTIYSCIPAELFHSQYNRYMTHNNQNSIWILSDDESADSRIRSQLQNSKITELSEAPDSWEKFLHASAIWIDDKTDISAATLRKIILSVAAWPRNLTLASQPWC